MTPHLDFEPAFTTGAGLRAGFSRRDLDSAFFERPFTGLRAVRGADEGDDATRPTDRELQLRATVRRARQFSVLMGAAEFFSHTTAAVLWGLPLPWVDADAIHVSVRAPGRALRCAGVVGHQLAGRGVTVQQHPEHHVRLTSPAATWALLGTVLRHPYDLVAVADAALWVDRVAGPHGWIVSPALAGRAELEASIPFKRKGVVALREALSRARPGVASRPETWMRLTLVDAGLEEPETDVDVYTESGTFIGCVDLAFPARKIAIEYEGDHHRIDKAQWNRDIEKHDALVRAGWRVIRVTAQMLFSEPRRLVSLTRSALRHAR
ncbi:MAG TPA: hypothetical protein VJR25_00080 [Microbacterium sp.]|uniref:endonuclease domain-containing protein n=1 Tax=Microbacterium sp. TaxID=51671 RepID=UPI002B461FF7|nr:hypothetical protein [Microbacterium sp.]HKT55141.1 hypothetical protein [Microbacterium sp.]